jgi:hypothetical protein
VQKPFVWNESKGKAMRLQGTGERAVTTSRGIVNAQPGDWIVEDAFGYFWVFPHEVFLLHFRKPPAAGAESAGEG